MSLRSGCAWVEQVTREGGDFREGEGLPSVRGALSECGIIVCVCVVQGKHWEAFEPLACLNHILVG